MIAGTAAVMLISRSHGQRTWESPHRIPVAFLQAPGLAEVRRAIFGPGLWPGPCRQARWAGRGLRRSRAGPEDRFCEAVRNNHAPLRGAAVEHENWVPTRRWHGAGLGWPGSSA
jgi:hypothetical protein